MLNALLLLNEEQVAFAILGLLQGLAAERSGRRRRVALYVEREFPERSAFEVRSIPDAGGIVRRRAVGRAGPAAVKPKRGSPRVGSEGPIAFIISQVVAAWPSIYANQPGPDRIRSARNPIGALVIVTDFVGSGTRVNTILDKFWNVPSVRAWVSRRWVEFMIVTAAGTSAGMESVRAHRLKPRVLAAHVAPTMFNAEHGFNASDEFNPDDEKTETRWREMLRAYGPENTGDAREGFGGNAALMEFSYRIPNNTPLLLHKSGGGWHALYTGHAPEDLRLAFGQEAPEQRIEHAATAIGVELATRLSVDDAQIVLALSAIRGRWRDGAETAIAEMTGLTVPEIIIIRRRATKAGLLTAHGRVTDAGHTAMRAGTLSERQRPDIPTAVEPYYPTSLRVPRARSSVRRPLGRP